MVTISNSAALIKGHMDEDCFDINLSLTGVV